MSCGLGSEYTVIEKARLDFDGLGRQCIGRPQLHRDTHAMEDTRRVFAVEFRDAVFERVADFGSRGVDLSLSALRRAGRQVSASAVRGLAGNRRGARNPARVDAVSYAPGYREREAGRGSRVAESTQPKKHASNPRYACFRSAIKVFATSMTGALCVGACTTNTVPVSRCGASAFSAMPKSAAEASSPSNSGLPASA